MHQDVRLPVPGTIAGNESPSHPPGSTSPLRSPAARSSPRSHPALPRIPYKSSSAPPASKAGLPPKFQSTPETSNQHSSSAPPHLHLPILRRVHRTRKIEQHAIRVHQPDLPCLGAQTPPASAPQSPPAPGQAAAASPSHEPPTAAAPTPRAAPPTECQRCSAPHPRQTHSELRPRQMAVPRNLDRRRTRHHKMLITQQKTPHRSSAAIPTPAITTTPQPAAIRPHRVFGNQPPSKLSRTPDFRRPANSPSSSELVRIFARIRRFAYAESRRPAASAVAATPAVPRAEARLGSGASSTAASRFENRFPDRKPRARVTKNRHRNHIAHWHQHPRFMPATYPFSNSPQHLPKPVAVAIRVLSFSPCSL